MSMIVKVFFSQPMHGLTDEEIKLERSYMMSEFKVYIIKELGLDFDDDVVIQDVNYLFNEKGPDGCGRLWYLGRSIQKMGEADYIVFHKDYKEASGCKVEYEAACRYFRYKLSLPENLQTSTHIYHVFMYNMSHDS